MRLPSTAPVSLQTPEVSNSESYFLNDVRRIYHNMRASKVNNSISSVCLQLLTLVPLQVLLTHGVFDGHVGEEAFVLLLQLSDLSEEVLSFSSPDVFHQLQLLHSHRKTQMTSFLINWRVKCSFICWGRSGCFSETLYDGCYVWCS